MLATQSLPHEAVLLPTWVQPRPRLRALLPAPVAARDVEERALLRSIARNDAQALRTLYARYHARLFAFAERRLGDAGAAEETVVDVFVEVWRNAANFRGDSQLSTWIYGIAHFKCLAAQRACGRSKRSSVTSVDDETLARFSADGSPEDQLEARDQLRRVREAVLLLPADLRDAVEMIFFDALSYAEVATRLGVSEHTVKMRIATARARLRRRLRLERA
jgi:RNA polymerase sigma-70 factor (ECF subfamily)